MYHVGASGICWMFRCWLWEHWQIPRMPVLMAVSFQGQCSLSNIISHQLRERNHEFLRTTMLSQHKPTHDKTNKTTVRPAKTQISLGICPVWSESSLSDQPGHLPSLISVFAVCIKKAWVLSYPFSGQRRLWSDWADAQSDLSLRWAHRSFCWFCHDVAHMYSACICLFIMHALLSVDGWLPLVIVALPGVFIWLFKCWNSFKT